MSNLPDDFWSSKYWARCNICGQRYHMSEAYCSCCDDLADCHCTERDWWHGPRGITCERCGGLPGEVLEEEEDDE